MPGRGFMTTEFLLEEVGAIQGVQRKFLPALAVFQVPTGRNNQYTKET